MSEEDALDQAYAKAAECLEDPRDWDRAKVRECAREAAAVAAAAFCAEGGPAAASACGVVARELAGPIVDAVYEVADWFGANADAKERKRQSKAWDAWVQFDKAVMEGSAAADNAVQRFVRAINDARTEQGRWPVRTDLIVAGLMPRVVSDTTDPETGGFIDVRTGHVTFWKIRCRGDPYLGENGRWVYPSTVSANCVADRPWRANMDQALDEQAEWMQRFALAASRELIVRSATLAAEIAAAEQGRSVDLDELERAKKKKQKVIRPLLEPVAQPGCMLALVSLVVALIFLL